MRTATGVLLVICNGIGAGMEALYPLVKQPDPDTMVVGLDVSGIGSSPDSPLP